ncbi:MAG TPA: hypothetical protein VHX90_00930 [Verrucomicrobiae bacterium]|jgi:hypothetical protein|nr:hypothetical protein [Verrucomicrobiae bacterium]
MKLSTPLFLLTAVILISGCASKKTAPAKIAAAPQMIVTPDNSLAGKVVSYNSAGRFVVLNFPNGQMPRMDQILFLYRAGLKVAEVKITGPQSDSSIVADLLAGDAQSGDEARDQ